MSEHKVYGVTLNDDVMYSEDPLVIAVEILGTQEVSYDLHEASKKYKRIWRSGWEAREKASEGLSAGLFYQKYPKFNMIIKNVIGCDSGRYRGKGRDIMGSTVFIRNLTDEEFYRLPEYQ